jgi:hypothetical protein
LVATSLCQSDGRYPPPHGIYHKAAPSESTEAFQARLRKIVRDRGKPFGFIILGDPSNIEPLKEAPPYPWADKP